MTGKKKILVVDDDELLLDVTRELLRDDTHDIFTHCEAAGVLGLASRLQPDLVLLDINMPRVSGESLALWLLTDRDTCHLRIVFYSSNDEDSLRESVTACGVHGYICKGDIKDLRAKVDHYLGMPTCSGPDGAR